MRATFPTIPDRVLTAILVITNRKKALTVFGLIFIRLAISLLVSPSVSNSTVSCSRRVKRNCCATADMPKTLGATRSSKIPVTA